jgi:hypothetical protein
MILSEILVLSDGTVAESGEHRINVSATFADFSLEALII